MKSAYFLIVLRTLVQNEILHEGYNKYSYLTMFTFMRQIQSNQYKTLVLFYTLRSE